MKKFILFIIFCSSFLCAQDPAGIWIPTKDNQLRGGINFYTYTILTDTAINITYNSALITKGNNGMLQ
jgi:hypothetical protein